MVKDLSVNAGDIREAGCISGLGRSPGEGNGNPLQYYGLKNTMDRGAWWTMVHRVTKSWPWVKWLRTHVCLCVCVCVCVCVYKSEKAMATHSSTLAWQIPWMEEPGRLQSMGSLEVRHDWATSLSLFTSMYWRRKWQPTPVFLPGESQGQGSLVGSRLWGHTESDTTEAT